MGSVTSLLCFVLLTTVVFLGVVVQSSLASRAGGVIIASFLDEVERTAAGSSTVVEGEDSASESLSVVTRSVVELVLDVGPLLCHHIWRRFRPLWLVGPLLRLWLLWVLSLSD